MPRLEAMKQPTSFDYSDSESQLQGKPATKRQRISSDTDEEMIDGSADATASSTYDPYKNAHLKGRKRFNADLADIREACSAGLVLSGLRVKKIRPGDDDGSIEVVIEKLSSEHVLSVNLFISDTSEYPGSHSVFSYSPDTDLPSELKKIVEEIVEASSKPLGKTVVDLLASVGRVVGSTGQKVVHHDHEDVSDDDDDEGHSGDDYDAYEDYDDIGGPPSESDSVMTKLQENFVDIVATEYRPGFIRLGGNDFVISVSLPVITLADLIPPRALMAWDRRLLASSQHLTLLISGFHGLYPVLEHDATYTAPAQRLGVSLSFKVGLSEKYKPGTTQVQEVVRKHGLIIQDAEDELRIQAELAAQKAREYAFDIDYDEDEPMQEVVEEEEEFVDPGRFDSFSLSSSLESLMDQSFLKLVQIRINFSLGWAGAELLISEVEKSQQKEEVVLALRANEIRQADLDERELGRTTNLPHDPLVGLRPQDPFNLPLTAFCYLVRRLALCPKYCIVCHNKLKFDFEALKPYVCDSKLCSYQYYSLNRGPSLEYEILHNSQTVDLLVSLAYVSASGGVMDDPLPIGLGLRVPIPGNITVSAPQHPITWASPNQPPPVVVPEIPKVLTPGPDGLCDFDDLTVSQMRLSIAKLMNTLPSIDDMKRHLQRKVKAGKSKPKLREMDANAIPAAWSILRWVVASCTAHIEPIDSGEELIKNLDPSWRQFRLTVGAPDAEAKFKGALEMAAAEDSNVRTYPVIYAFHGSPLRNWHSIIRHGLWYRTISHGRAYGDGVYLAKDATTSMSSYAQAGRTAWQKSMSGPTNCVAVTEVVNQPSKFVSSNPHYVVKDTHWIMCRYLLVRGTGDFETPKSNEAKSKNAQVIPFVKHDPNHKTAVGGKVIEIPDPSYKVESLLEARKADYVHEDPDGEDMAIFELDSNKAKKSADQNRYDLDDENDYLVPVASSSKAKVPHQRRIDDWKHDAEYVATTLENLLLPPFESSPSASMAIQRELKSMLKEQEMAPSLKELGWYMPPELIGDNLYQWIVEMHSLDPVLPIAKDMKQRIVKRTLHNRNINSIIFEIRFPPTFPNSPPFFRIITPRFLPFIQGGGGHVTGGGSICMDLLTSDGWLPSYSISAVLMQIRLALSNLEPKPARLSNDWIRPYGVQESLAGYKRAAATHNWTLPAGLDRLVR